MVHYKDGDMISYTVIMVGQRNMQGRAFRMYELVVGKQATGRYIGGGRGKTAPPVGYLPTTNSNARVSPIIDYFLIKPKDKNDIYLKRHPPSATSKNLDARRRLN